MTPRLVLASASPARLKTLRSAGLDPEVVVSGVDETGVDTGDPGTTAVELARRKAAAVAEMLDGPALVVGCDSVLALGDAVHGKPASAQEAVAHWRQMRGGYGVLHTGHCVVDGATGRSEQALGSTTVWFADLTDAEVEAYVATGEPLEVAGAFTLDGLGGAFVRRIDGDPHNVVGISLPLLREMFTELGVVWTELWR